MRSDIKRALENSGAVTLGFKGSLKKIEAYLDQDEEVFYMISTNATMNPGDKFVVDNMVIKGKEPVVFVITDKRVILYFKVLFSEKFEQFPINEIREYKFVRNSMVGSKLRVITLTKTFDLDLNYKQETIDIINQVLSSVKGKNDASTKDKKTEDEGIIESIKNLSKLKDAGILSEEEFRDKKKELLDRI